MRHDPARFVNRELSWLEFNQRVLDEARDERLPLLERLRFLAITASNLDEFFMVRVGGLQMLSRQGSTKRDPAGLTPDEQLAAIAERTRQMVHDQYACHLDELVPALAAAGIRGLGPGDLSERQRSALETRFDSDVFPILTPMAVDSESPFPMLVNQSLNLLVALAPAEGGTERRYAVIPLGGRRGRFLALPRDDGHDHILLEDVVAMFANHFLPGVTVEECVPFRISRNADLSVREDMASDLLAEMEQVLDARKESTCVRLEIAASASAPARAFLQTMLDVPDEQLYAVPGPLDLAAFTTVASLPDFEELTFEPWPPQPCPAVDPRSSIFDVLSRQNVLIYQPFESFEPVVRLLEEAADDPDVIAIKQVLYRTSQRSPIVAALRRAGENGKYVTAVLELKARFDEARNIEWAKDLERASVQVIYGVKGFKIHAKVCLIVRREPQGIQRYVHYGTGNYNETTARLYTDVSYMTTDEDLGADATAFFNAMNGYTQVQDYRKISMAPIGIRSTLIELIEAEAERKRQGQKAAIMAKFNSLADPAIIDALYAASQAGVPIQLNVRGICCLRPGVAGLSENISVVSIVDRFLEHSRIFYFHHGGDELVYISSADCMPRNLDKRLELLVPVEDPAARARLVRILETCLRDTVKGRRILPDGGYERIEPSAADGALGSQAILYGEACRAVKQAAESKRMILEPHRAPGEGS